MRFVPLLLLLALSTGCVSTNATLLNPTPTPRPKVSPALVRIYRSLDQIRERYEEIAILNATGESNWTNEQEMLESMRRKAGEVGANAVVLDAIQEAGAGAKVAAAIFGTGTQRKGRALAIFVFSARDSTASKDSLTRVSPQFYRQRENAGR